MYYVSKLNQNMSLHDFVLHIVRPEKRMIGLIHYFIPTEPHLSLILSVT